jgi:hypothetical protein
MKRTKQAPEIPAAFHEIADEYNLVIKHDYYMRRYFVRDEAINASHVDYQEWEFMTLTAEKLTADIEEAIDNYEYKPLEIPMGRGRNRRINGTFDRMEKIQ